MPNRRRRKLSTAMSAVAALAVASPVAVTALSDAASTRGCPAAPRVRPGRARHRPTQRVDRRPLAGPVPVRHQPASDADRAVDRVDRRPADSTVTSPGLTSPGLTSPGLTSPGLTSPGLTAPGLTSPGLTSPGLTTPGLTTPGLTTPGLTAPAATTPGLTVPPVLHDARHDVDAAGLTTPGLTTPGLTTPGLTNPALTSPTGLTPGLTRPSAYPVPVRSRSPSRSGWTRGWARTRSSAIRRWGPCPPPPRRERGPARRSQQCRPDPRRGTGDRPAQGHGDARDHVGDAERRPGAVPARGGCRTRRTRLAPELDHPPTKRHRRSPRLCGAVADAGLGTPAFSRCLPCRNTGNTRHIRNIGPCRPAVLRRCCSPLSRRQS